MKVMLSLKVTYKLMVQQLTVNSTQTTVNDPIMMVGDTTSTRTVMVAVQSGVSTVIVDQVTGIAVNDTLLHSSLLNWYYNSYSDKQWCKDAYLPRYNYRWNKHTNHILQLLTQQILILTVDLDLHITLVLEQLIQLMVSLD